MNRVTEIYYEKIKGRDRVKSVRIVNEETGDENLLNRFELKEPDRVSIGDKDAFKVSLAADVVFDQYQTLQRYGLK